MDLNDVKTKCSQTSLTVAIKDIDAEDWKVYDFLERMSLFDLEEFMLHIVPTQKLRALGRKVKF